LRSSWNVLGITDTKIKSDDAAGKLEHMVSESKAEFDRGKGRKF
jgi:hypothetical protein